MIFGAQQVVTKIDELPRKQCCLLLGGCNKPRMSNEVSISGETTCCKPLMIYRYKCGLKFGFDLDITSSTKFI